MGRRAELAAVEHLLAGARDGRSGVLVVRGEAGIGKSELLERAGDAAALSGFRVERAVGVESETQFAFAGLHQLCAPLLRRAEALPAPQQAALGVAFGKREGAAPERFLVALATLHLLAEVAEDGPVLCLLDDVQWLDQASAEVLAFVARRVVAERVALVFAMRDPGGSDVDPFAGLPELRPAGLGETDARALLASALRTPLDEEVRDRVVAEARGNPLALLELPRASDPTRLAGGFEGPDLLGVPRRVEEAFRRRSGSLPTGSQLLVLVAATEPTGEAALLWRAAERLGIDGDAAVPAEAAGLVEIDTQVRFRHPLVRSAVYRAATPGERRRVHGALAAVTDPLTDPDRRAWHRARAVLGTDEEAAAELERSADRARVRGGVAAAAGFLQQATELTPEPGRRARRALEAAHAKHEAGASEVALELLEIAATGPLDALRRARIDLLRAQIAFHLTRGHDVPGLLLAAAATLAPLDAALARGTYLHALDAAIITSRDRGGVLEVAEAARAVPAPPVTAGPVDLLLDGLVTTYTQGYEAGVPGLRRALDAFRGHRRWVEGAGDGANHRWLLLATRTAVALYDDETADALATRNVRLAREIGALGKLPAALTALSTMVLLNGELNHAAELAAEGTEIARASGAVPTRHPRLVAAGWRGREADTAELSSATARNGTVGGRSVEVANAEYALAVLHNALGNYPSALDAAARACDTDELPTSSLALPELVEAASRAGEPERAAGALEELGSRARACGTPWALGLLARSRALTMIGPAAEEHYREAVEQLRACRMATHLARAHLVYGEWLRREGRRQDARAQLRTGHEMLSGMGAEGFAARAARELRATGEHPRKRTPQPTDALTAQELHVARLVATGSTSREVGAQLFLSPRTIEAHLRSIFRKLGITSRRQLRDLWAPPTAPA